MRPFKSDIYLHYQCLTCGTMYTFNLEAVKQNPNSSFYCCGISHPVDKIITNKLDLTFESDYDRMKDTVRAALKSQGYEESEIDSMFARAVLTDIECASDMMRRVLRTYESETESVL